MLTYADDNGGTRSHHLHMLTYADVFWHVPQAIGQRTIKAESAAIIYAMDPVYAAGFSYVLLGERLGVQGFAGGALLLNADISRMLTDADGC